MKLFRNLVVWLLGLAAPAVATMSAFNPVTVLTLQGRPAVGATVSVVTEAGAPVTLYSDRAGTQAFNGVVPSTGLLQLFAAPGVYIASVSGAGVNRTWYWSASDEGVQDEGVNLTRRPKINFVGSGVTCADDSANNVTKCTIATGEGGGISSLNGLTDATQTFALDLLNSGPVWTSSGSVHTLSLPNATVGARGLVSTGSQTFQGNKSISGTLSVFQNADMAKGLLVNGLGASNVFQVKGSSDPFLIITDVTSDLVGVGTDAPEAKLHAVTTTSFQASLKGDATSGPGVYGISASAAGAYGVSTSSNGVLGLSTTGTGVRGTSGGAAAAGRFTRTNHTNTNPVVEIVNSDTLDTQPTVRIKTAANPFAVRSALEVLDSGDVLMVRLSNNGKIHVADGIASLPSISAVSDPTTGIYFGGSGAVAVSSNGATVATFGSARTEVGELNVSGVSSDGTGKVVCVKSTGDLGTCSDQPDSSGICTCG